MSYWKDFVIRQPIYFDYDFYPTKKHCDENECYFQNETHHSDNNILLPSECSSVVKSNSIVIPSAKVNFHSKRTQWESYNEISQKKEIVSLLQPKSKYYIDVLLHIPESNVNKNIGIFMVHVTLYSNNAPLGTSKRSAMVPYESYVVFHIRRTSLFVLFLLGIIQEYSNVIVHSFDNFMERIDYPLVSFMTVTTFSLTIIIKSGACIELITPPYSKMPVQISSAGEFHKYINTYSLSTIMQKYA